MAEEWVGSKVVLVGGPCDTPCDGDIVDMLVSVATVDNNAARLDVETSCGGWDVVPG